MTNAEKLFMHLNITGTNEAGEMTAKLHFAKKNGLCDKDTEFIVKQQMKLEIGLPVMLTGVCYRGTWAYRTRDTAIAEAEAAFNERLFGEAMSIERALVREATEMFTDVLGHLED